MPKKMEVYKCDVCGNIVEVLFPGSGGLVCCNKPMSLLKENSMDAATEKHVPVVERTDSGIKVKVGEVAHPMEDEHYIAWIEVIAGDQVLRKDLKPGAPPEAEFDVSGDDIVAREYCTLHGQWKC